VRPELRPPLPEELDRLIPDLVERLAALDVRATWFVLGEVARRLPGRIREVAEAGHEIACHGDLHLRANERSPAGFRTDLERAKGVLEEILGTEVFGYRAPEWSLRSAANPRLRLVAACGFRYDSSLTAAIGAGAAANGARLRVLRWTSGESLIEVPPATWGGSLRLPVGGWTGRLAPPALLAAAARRAIGRGETPLYVVHPWELVTRPCPGAMTGLARFFHEAGRTGFSSRFARLASDLRFELPVGEALGLAGSANGGRDAFADEATNELPALEPVAP